MTAMKDTRVQMTQRLLKDSMLTLLKDNNIKHITVKQVCDGCGLNRSTFYLHYMDVYDLYDHVVNDFLNEIFDVLRPSIFIREIEKLPQIYQTICEYYLAHRDTILVLMDKGGLEKMFNSLYEKEIENLGDLIGNYTDEMEILFCSWGAQMVLYDWIAHHPNKPMEEVIDLLIDINSRLGYYGKK